MCSATAMWLQILLTQQRRKTEEREVAITWALFDVRVDGEASVNDCKKYGQQFSILVYGDQGSQNHTSSIHVRQKGFVKICRAFSN